MRAVQRRIARINLIGLKCRKRGTAVLNMAGVLSRLFEQIKTWIAGSWTYLWAFWFILVIFLVYILRGPLKLGENLSYGKIFNKNWHRTFIDILVTNQ